MLGSPTMPQKPGARGGRMRGCVRILSSEGEAPIVAGADAVSRASGLAGSVEHVRRDQKSKHFRNGHSIGLLLVQSTEASRYHASHCASVVFRFPLLQVVSESLLSLCHDGFSVESV